MAQQIRGNAQTSRRRLRPCTYFLPSGSAHIRRGWFKGPDAAAERRFALELFAPAADIEHQRKRTNQHHGQDGNQHFHD